MSTTIVITSLYYLVHNLNYIFIVSCSQTSHDKEAATLGHQTFVYSETGVLSGLISSVRRALASKLRGPGFKSQPGTVGGPATIIMWGARLGWKLALS